MSKIFAISQAFKRGFTMMELLTTVGILALLMAIAVPSFVRSLPYAHVRTEAKAAQSLMQRARLLAANAHKPIRVVVDCKGHSDSPGGTVVSPCEITLQQALYSDKGQISKWRLLENGKKEMHKNVMVVYNGGTGTPTNLTRHTKMFDGSAAGKGGLGTSATDTLKDFVVIFMPNGQAITPLAPYSLLFVSEEFNRSHNRAAWNMTFNATTGAAALAINK